MKQLSLLIIGCLLLSHSLTAQVNVSDSLELVKLYNTTGGDDWTYVKTVYGASISGLLFTPNPENPWLEGNVSNWRGIVLSPDGLSVQSIILSSTNLVGNMPDLNLPNLTELRLRENQLSGNIPSFNKLPSLTLLSLYKNKLSGNIPTFNNLPKLSILYLDENELSGTIPDFSNLTELTWLDLYGNQLTFEGLEQNMNLNITGCSLSPSPCFRYSPQAKIPIYESDSTIYVQAGGTLSNNTYNWYEVNNTITPIYTTIGDSTFTPTISSGIYYCEVSNSICTNPILSWQNLVLRSKNYCFGDTTNIPNIILKNEDTTFDTNNPPVLLCKVANPDEVNTYHWQKDGVEIPNAYTPFLFVTTATSEVPLSAYSVSVTYADGCSKAANYSGKAITFEPSSNLLPFNIYPNPNQGIFSLQLPTNSFENAQLYIYNTQGKLSVQQTVDGTSIDVSHLKSGVYILKIITDKNETQHLEKLVIY